VTKKSPVSTQQNQWFDSQQVTDEDLSTEQTFNNTIQTGLINNHIGTGVLADSLSQQTIFDSSLAVGFLDGVAVFAQNQPTDTNLGNQLSLQLTGSAAAGRRAVKVAIIGLDFQKNLQYDTFYFRQNEIQITTKHYTNVLLILFNDFIGTATQSLNLGGRLVIKEVPPITISRDPIMVAQASQPNLFFRDFFTADNSALQTFLANSLPLFNVDNLNITTAVKESLLLTSGDVTTQIGEKFLASTNNIQKVSLLLSVQNTLPGQSTNLVWQGDLVVSIYPLQSSVQCPTDIVPNLAIDFPPSNVPLAQISFNYTTLQQAGILLDGNPQPIDFVFSSTQVAGGSAIKVGSYYAITVKRSGAANQCDIILGTGGNITPNSFITTFTGTNWVDIPESNLWFQVWTDAAKVSDGQAYDTGRGIIIPKTAANSSGVQADFALNAISFSGNDAFTGVLSATIQQSVPVQDQRTGNLVNSRQQTVPSLRLLNPLDLSNLTKTTEPFGIGVIEDGNVKSFNLGTSTITSNLHAWTFFKNQLFIKVIDDITDGYRYDPSVLALITDFVNGAFVGAKITPDASDPNTYYRISSATLCSMIYGDVNNDGIVDAADITSLNKLLGFDLNSTPPLNSQITTNGSQTTVVNGYTTYVNPFVNDFGLSFQLVDPLTNNVILAQNDGVLTVNPNDGSLATFESGSTDFSTVVGLTNLNLVILGSVAEQDVGSFTIQALDVASHFIIDIRKLFLNASTMGQILRADIDGDMKVDANDATLLQNYINKTPPFPPVSLPANRIGTRFNVLSFTLEPFLYKDLNVPISDRTDDFLTTAGNRATILHTLPDIFDNDGYFANHDMLHNPIGFVINKELVWYEYLIASSANARLVPTVFTTSTGLTINACSPVGNVCQSYPELNGFDPGRVDMFVPNNLVIGAGGQITNTDGSNYKIDFEIYPITLEIPNTFLGVERSINVFDIFVADYQSSGLTRFGFESARFADCSTVQPTALANNQIRFAVASVSFTPTTETGIDIDGYAGILEGIGYGVYLDPTTGILRLNFAYLYEDPIFLSMNTKLGINVLLKKAGFNNTPLLVNRTQMSNLLGLQTDPN
jgi:hypothetical protein